MAFSFGAPKTSASSGNTFSQGQNSTGGFNFAGQAGSTSAGSSGFSFGSQSSAAAVNPPNAGGFSFGAPAATTTSAIKPAPAAATGFSFGTTSNPQPAINPPAPTGFSFGTPAASKPTPAPASTGFSFGKPASSSAALVQPVAPIQPEATTTSGSFGFGAPSAATTSLASQTGTAFGASTIAKPATAGFSFGAPTASTAAPVASTFKLGAGTTQATGFSLSTSTATNATSAAAPAAKSSFNFSTPSGSTLPKSASVVLGSAPAVSTSATSGFKLPATTTATTSSTSTAPLKQVSYKALEETIDKWLNDLTEQEKSFLNQAAQVNMWDKQLIENGEKISEVHSEVERLKAEQGRLDRELEFILSQQDELEKLLSPVEAQVNSHPMITHTQHADIERERTYGLADNIDSQLKHMMQSLNEIIDHINSSNANPTASAADESMTQIAKILNAHMDSLQWIDQNTNKLQHRVKEVSHLMDAQRKEQERSFHLTSYE